MKNLPLQLSALFFALLFSISSCSKDDEILVDSGVIYTDYPPEELFQSDGNYAETLKVWVDFRDVSEFRDAGQGCSSYWDQNSQSSIFYDCGMWKKVIAQKYWGVKDGIIFLSEAKDWYVINPDNYWKLRDQLEKKNTVIGNVCNGCPNPFGNSSSITWIE